MDHPPGLERSEWLERARRFRQEVIEPMEPHRREWIEDPDERFPWEVVEEGSRLGFKTMGVPTRFGGGGASKLEIALVVEELAAGDMSIAVIFDQCIKISKFIDALGTEEQKAKYFPPFVQDHRYLLTIASNDPDHTTDRSTSRRAEALEGRTLQLSTTASEQDGRWTINGVKYMPSLSSTAKLAVVLAQTEPNEPIHRGTTYFLVPTDTPGVGITKVWDKVSQRLVDNATIIFEDVVVPAENMLGARAGRSMAPQDVTAAGGNITAAATALGTARSAYEAAVAHARERIQGGRPIIEHQAVGMMLAQMAAELEAVRSIVWRAAQTFDEGDKATPLQQMAKWMAAETGVRVCKMAMEVFGALGIMRDYPVQKAMRDCLSFLHSDGTQQGRLLVIQQQLLDGKLPYRAAGQP